MCGGGARQLVRTAAPRGLGPPTHSRRRAWRGPLVAPPTVFVGQHDETKKKKRGAARKRGGEAGACRRRTAHSYACRECRRAVVSCRGVRGRGARPGGATIALRGAGTRGAISLAHALPAKQRKKPWPCAGDPRSSTPLLWGSGSTTACALPATDDGPRRTRRPLSPFCPPPSPRPRRGANASNAPPSHIDRPPRTTPSTENASIP